MCKTLVHIFSLVGWFLNMAANVDFSRGSDMVMLGDCDKTVQNVCDKLGWKEDLEKIEVQNLEDIS